MVYLYTNEVLFILLIQDVITTILVGHNSHTILAHLLQYIEKLFTSELLSLIIVVSNNCVYLTCTSLLNSNNRSLGCTYTSLVEFIVSLPFGMYI